MSGKITAHFGADVSEVEAGMLQAQRATKRYEQAVKALDKGPSGLSSLNKDAPKVVGIVKDLASKLGMAGAAAGLVPGLGVAAIGVAGVVAGVEMIRDYYKEAAESAKEIADFMTRSGKRQAEAADAVRTDKEKLEFQRKQTEELKTQWKITTNGFHTDKEILQAREQYDIAAIKLAEMERAAKKDGAEAEEKARKEHSAKVDADFNRDDANAKRNLEVQKNIADAQKAVDDAKKKADEEQKKRDDDEQKRFQEAEQMEYDRIWRFASTDQKIAQVRKEGKAAQAAYDKDASADNLKALEAARKKWLDLRDEINGAKKDATTSDALVGNGRTRDENGKLTRGGVIISEADAARTDSTIKRNGVLNRQAMSGRIRDSGKVGADGETAKSNQILEQIRVLLTPKKR